MKQGTCVKCKSRRVARFSGAINVDNGTGATELGSLAAEHYVCADCRYFESYLAGEGLVFLVADNETLSWVNPPDSTPYR